MPDLDAHLPELLTHEAAFVRVPPLEGLRTRSRHRRQRRAAALSLLAVVAAVPLALTLTQHQPRRSGQLAVRPFTTLDAYPQQSVEQSASPSSLRTSGSPVLHLHVRSAGVSSSPDGPVLDVHLDAAGALDLAAVPAGTQVAFTVDGVFLSAPLFQSRLTQGEVQLTVPQTAAQLVQVAHRLTDDVNAP